MPCWAVPKPICRSITMGAIFEGVNVVAKIMELVVNNGKCAICGKQIGPLTGDPRTFESIEGVQEGLPGTGFLLDDVPG